MAISRETLHPDLLDTRDHYHLHSGPSKFLKPLHKLPEDALKPKGRQRIQSVRRQRAEHRRGGGVVEGETNRGVDQHHTKCSFRPLENVGSKQLTPKETSYIYAPAASH